MVPVPPVLAAMLRAHYRCHGTAPDGRLFGGTRGGPLSESVYGRVWHAARALALGPELAATGLARRPYDLRHAALSLWLPQLGLGLTWPCTTPGADQHHTQLERADQRQGGPRADQRADRAVAHAVRQVGTDRGHDARAEAPGGQPWYGLVPAAGVQHHHGRAQISPSTVNGSSRAVTPDSPCERTSSYAC